MAEQSPQVSSPLKSAHAFYLDALQALDQQGVQYLVGGGYAMTFHTGITRPTKDLDIFCRKPDSERALDVLDRRGYRTERTWPHFLVKALHEEAFIDILHNSGNGLCPVDEEWFAHAVWGTVLGRNVRVCPAEEVLWTKAFVQSRDRFDGADIAHLILACGQDFDWPRLMKRFRSHERVLLIHLLMFGYTFPSEQERIPPRVIEELYGRVGSEEALELPVCRGPLLSPTDYQVDLQQRGFIAPDQERRP